MAKLKFSSKEEWLNSNMGQRMIEEAQRMLDNAIEQLHDDTYLFGVVNDEGYEYPRLCSIMAVPRSRVMNACLAFAKWASTVLEKEWKSNGNIWDIVWNIATTEECDIRSIFLWVLAGTEYKGEDFILSFTPWWP